MKTKLTFRTLSDGSKVWAAVPAHTPGPWFHDGVTVSVDTRGIGSIYAADIAVMVNDGIFPQSVKGANATLIASTPDLLAGCLAILAATGGSEHWQGETHEALLLIEAAMKKAVVQP